MITVVLVRQRGPTGYFFKIYALDTVLDLAPTSKKADLEKAMKGHIIAQGELVVCT